MTLRQIVARIVMVILGGVVGFTLLAVFWKTPVFWILGGIVVVLYVFSWAAENW